MLPLLRRAGNQNYGAILEHLKRAMKLVPCNALNIGYSLLFCVLCFVTLSVT